MNDAKITKRLSQIRESLLSEGWLYVGANGHSVLSFRHANGNRMTIIADELYINYVKNGVLVKREAHSATANPST